jgi:integrase
MPKKFFMNWQADKSRWRKMHNGKWYFVTPKELGCGSTKEASWKAANIWWHDRLATISGPILDQTNSTLLKLLEHQGTSIKDAIITLNDRCESGKVAAKVLELLTAADKFSKSDDDNDVPNALSAAQRLQEGNSIAPSIFNEVLLGDSLFELLNKEEIRQRFKEFQKENGPEVELEKRLENFDEWRKLQMSSITELQREKKINQELNKIFEKITNEPQVELEKKIGYHFDEWCKLQISSIKSPARIKMNIHMLGFFREYIGGDAEVSQITEARWVEFYRWLNAKDNLSDNYKKRIFNTAKIFLIYLYEGHLIELPRKLKSKDLIFATTINEVEIIDDHSLRQFYSSAKGQTKLHILLMLNCGMTAQDISDLKSSEVDWDNRTITRKRSKTKHHESAPKVTFLLWETTFRLLLQHRSNCENVLLTSSGKPWICDSIDDNKYRRSDCVASSFKWLAKKTGLTICPKNLRSTASSKLAEHSQYKFYAKYFLAHSPQSVADKHYVVPSTKEFFEALIWLERAFDLEGTTQSDHLEVSPTIEANSKSPS